MPVLPPTVPPQARFADLLLKEQGGLAAFINEAREANRSWDWIARELSRLTDRQVDVSDVTVKVWADRVEEAKTSADEAAAS